MATREKATLAGGCFWCLDAVYENLEGVAKVTSGYAGGSVANPTYEDVCSEETGHAEVVQVDYDPSRVSYRELLEVFFTIHDPTTPDRQGADVGTQYRSAIFYHDEAQKKEAMGIIRELEAEKAFPSRIVTEVAPLKAFYPAEDYHQSFYRRNPDQPYCRAVITPKLQKFRAKWSKKLKAPATA